MCWRVASRKCRFTKPITARREVWGKIVLPRPTCCCPYVGIPSVFWIQQKCIQSHRPHFVHIHVLPQTQKTTLRVTSQIQLRFNWSMWHKYLAWKKHKRIFFWNTTVVFVHAQKLHATAFCREHEEEMCSEQTSKNSHRSCWFVHFVTIVKNNDFAERDSNK